MSQFFLRDHGHGLLHDRVDAAAFLCKELGGTGLVRHAALVREAVLGAEARRLDKISPWNLELFRSVKVLGVCAGKGDRDSLMQVLCQGRLARWQLVAFLQDLGYDASRHVAGTPL